MAQQRKTTNTSKIKKANPKSDQPSKETNIDYKAVLASQKKAQQAIINSMKSIETALENQINAIQKDIDKD